MMQYTFELLAIDSAHLTASVEPLNELAKERWKVIAIVPFGASGKSYLTLLGREKEERAELLEPLAVDQAIIDQLPSTTAN